MVLGSEGQHEIIAASLEGLLAKIAVQQFEEDGEWTDFTPSEFVDDDVTDELLDWLVDRLGAREVEKLVESRRRVAGFRRLDGKMVSGSRGVLGGPSHDDAEAPKTPDGASARGPEPLGQPAFRRRNRRSAVSDARVAARLAARGRACSDRTIAAGIARRKVARAKRFGLWYSMSFVMSANGRILAVLRLRNASQDRRYAS